jgi:cell division protease FtsH
VAHQQVLGAVPTILEQQAAALDAQDRQAQQPGAATTSSTSSSSSSSSSDATAAAPDGGDDLAASLTAKGVPAELASAAAAALKLDDATLADVSRAIMGRLDIVDLVGKNTAYEVAERVSVFGCGSVWNRLGGQGGRSCVQGGLAGASLTHPRLPP